MSFNNFSESTTTNINVGVAASTLTDEFNKVSSIKKACPLRDLPINVPQKIIKMKKVNTRFGEKIMVELEDCVVFLGPRFNDVITEEKLNEVNKIVKYGSSFLKSTNETGDLYFEFNEQSEEFLV